MGLFMVAKPEAKADDVLRRMLNTPPQPKKAKPTSAEPKAASKPPRKKGGAA